MRSYERHWQPGTGLNQNSVLTSLCLHDLPLFCLFLFSSSPAYCPTSLHSPTDSFPTSWTLRSASLSVAKVPFACSFLIAIQLVWLMRLASCLYLCYYWPDRFLSLSTLQLPPFPSYSILQGSWWHKFTGINIPTLHILLPLSATGPFWFFLLPRICQSGLCLWSCLWLPPFLKIPCCVEKVLDQTP